MEFYLPFFKQKAHLDFQNVVSWKVVDPSGWLRTGDILLFSGSSFMASAIKLFTASRWNHVGMACWCELTLKNGKVEKDLFSFELGSQAFTDLMTKKPTCLGVRMVRLADIASMYDLIAVRRLNRHNKYNQNAPSDGNEWAHRFQKFALKWKQTPYFGFQSLVKTYLFRPEAPVGQSTCAHIAAKMLDEIGVYPLDFDPCQVYPDAFSRSARAFPPEIFKGPEVIVYRDSGKINARLIFLITILVVIIVILFVMFIRSSKRSMGKKSNQT